MREHKPYRTPRNMGRSSRSAYSDSRQSSEYDRDMRNSGNEEWGYLEGGGSEPSSYRRYGSERESRYPGSGSPYSPFARDSEYSEFGSREPSRSSYDWRPGYSDESSRSSQGSYGAGRSNNYESDRFGSSRNSRPRSIDRYEGSRDQMGYDERGRSTGDRYEMSQYQQGRYGSQYGYENDRFTGGSQRRSGEFAGRGPKGYKRSDDRIKEDVCEMLTRDPSIDAENIEIEVRDGEVTLSGSVPERSMKHMAEDCVERCSGVKDVTNNLRVKKESESSTSSESMVGRSASSSSSRKSAGSSSLNS